MTKKIFALSIGLLLTILTSSVLADAPVTIAQNANTTKILHLATEETVTIDGKIHKIPSSWVGKKLTVRELLFEDFALIPTESSWQNSKLYMIKDAQKALVNMITKAKEDGITLIVHSAYRSKTYQKNIFRKMMAEGRTFNDIIRYVAPPGYSEHMLGTVVDFYPSNWSFADLDTYKWLQENGKLFGFSESYPQFGKKDEPWEPWHWRFIPNIIEATPAKKPEQQPF